MRKNEGGFSPLEGLLVFAIVGIIGFVGWWVYHSKNNAANIYNSVDRQSSTPAASNPYAGWKSYCDNNVKSCFKYPSDWGIKADNSEGSFVNITLHDPTDSVSAYYTSPLENVEPASGNFYTNSIDSLAADKNLKILGGYFTTNKSPGYRVIDLSLVLKNSFSVGKTSQNVENYLVYTNKSSTTKSSLGAYYLAPTAPLPVDQANDWFNSANAKTALQIMKSFYYRQ